LSDGDVQELVPGLWCVGQRLGGHVRAFLCDDGNELTLIDTLYDTKPTRILALIERVGRKPSDLKHIILSHSHRSHLGALAALKELTGATIYAHEWESDIIAGERKAQGVGLIPKRPYRVYIPFQLGVSLGFGTHVPCKVDQFVVGGDRVGPIEIVDASGHSPGHLGFLWSERKALVAGDAVATWPSLMPGWASFTLNERQHRESLRRLAEVEPAVLGVGHGPPITSGARECIRNLIDELGV
jgi:glyoxylase-like metal-dependent hydrolase (beta-lactamase superfamily II)